MLDAAASLPRAIPGADFVGRVAARLPAQDAWEAEREDGPRATSRRLRFALPAAAAAVVLLGVGFIAGRSAAPTPPAEDVAAIAARSGTIIVQMMLIEPDARSVVVVGDFNGWDPERSPLRKGDTGVWGTTLTLPRGRYHYMFLVDGTRWVADPMASETSSDGFGATNSVLDAEV